MSALRSAPVLPPVVESLPTFPAPETWSATPAAAPAAGYLGDRIALCLWICCAVLMAWFMVKDLVGALVRMW